MSNAAEGPEGSPLEWLEREIQTAVSRFGKERGCPDYWRPPLVGAVAADDPAIAELSRIVDPEHAAPRDLLASARSVIVYFLPFREWVGEENRRSGPFASRSWAESYTTTNACIAAVNLHIKDCLGRAGHEAATTPATHNFDEQKLVSRWSHKHLAWAAGLGTFGHHLLLITEAGCCGRLGSLVTSMELPPSNRPGREFCLLKAGKRCSACVARCSFDALFKDRFDRHACYRQCLANDAHYSDLGLVDVCGKCACGVPCSYGIPMEEAGARD
jgi:epoxyqueuosine reductase